MNRRRAQRIERAIARAATHAPGSAAQRAAAEELEELARKHPEEWAHAAVRAVAAGASPVGTPGAAFAAAAAPVAARALHGVPTWRNYLGQHAATPTAWREPVDLAALMRDVEAAGRTGRVKAIGSGHSSSDVAKPRDVLIDVRTHLHRFLDLDDVRPPAQRPARIDRLASVEAGARIGALNQRLLTLTSGENPDGLALANMGSFDEQSIIGALCTGTHGSGLALGPVSASVESIALVTLVEDPLGAGGARARVFQIEPGDGITDPTRFRAHPRKQGWELIQDDLVFDAVVVSMGCMGVVYALTLNVTPAYWLRETKVCRPWQNVRQTLLNEAGAVRHYEFLFNPYKTRQGAGARDHTCLVTKRDKIPWRDTAPPVRDLPGDFARGLERIFGTRFISGLLNAFSFVIPGTIDQVLRGLQTRGFESSGPNVLILGAGKEVKGISNEIGVKVAEAARAVDAIAGWAADFRARDIWHTSPLGVRFVAPARGLLSPQNWPDGSATCMIETPLLLGTRKSDLVLERIERGLSHFPGRPHWGQVNRLGALDVARLYPRSNDWLGVLRRFNRFRTFDNDFTARVGF